MKVWRVPYPKFGAGPGLDRVSAVAAQLGRDLSAFGRNGAVIVGSNGKGSTAAMCAALLQQASSPVGLFTSPHLFALNERFRIDGEDISDDELSLHWERVRAAVREAGVEGELGGFEFLFLIAADWFAARGCAHTVWEAGIGGRLDPVRLIQAQRVALTALDLEHTELLGHTLEEIARDKIEAAPAGAKLYVLRSGVSEAVKAHCVARGVEPVFVSADAVGDYVLPLAGAHQHGNAALALALARDLAPIDRAQTQAGLDATRWPGRLEVIEREPLVVIDVGHTPEGVRSALAGFQVMRSAREAVLVCGVSADKDAAAIVGALAPEFDVIICTAARHKGASPAAIATHAQAAHSAAEIVLAEDVAEARRLALHRAGGDGAVFVAGGLFLAAEFKAVSVGRDPASLAFF